MENMTSTIKVYKRRVEMEKESHSVYIPEDILVPKILGHLPVKYTCRFKCVCKRWEELISEEHLSRQSYIAMIRQVRKSSSAEHLQELTFPCNGKPITFSFRNMRDIKASCNGLLCALLNLDIIVFNPALGKRVSVPNPRRRSIIGLAYDPSKSSTEFKLVCPFSVAMREPVSYRHYRFEVYSAKTVSWTVSKSSVRSSGLWQHPRAIFASGALFWNAADGIIWFHTEKDLAGMVPFPRGTPLHKPLTEFGEWQSMLALTVVKECVDIIEVWIMSEFECKTSKCQWAKLYSLNLNNVIEKNMELCSQGTHAMAVRRRMPIEFIRRHWSFIRPLPFGGGEVIMWTTSCKNQIFCYEVKKEKLHKFAYRKAAHQPFFLFKKNLLPFPDI